MMNDDDEIIPLITRDHHFQIVNWLSRTISGGFK